MGNPPSGTQGFNVADPGLKSEFIAMQQAERFYPPRFVAHANVTDTVRSLQLDRARIREQLLKAHHPRYISMLKAALRDVERQL